MAPEAGIYLRKNQAWLQLGRGVAPVDPDPDPDPDPNPDPDPIPDPPDQTQQDASWLEMMAARPLYSSLPSGSLTREQWRARIAFAEAWYAPRVGHASVGISESDLTPGSLTSTRDGQVFEGIVGGQIKIRHNNVTYRGCRVNATGASYGVQFDPTFTSNLRGSLIENCDITYAVPALDQQTRHAMILVNSTSPANTARALTVRNCNVTGFTSAGGRLGNNVTWEYNWVHDFQYPIGPHANSCRPNGANVIARRNLLNEGRSAIASIYFDDGQPNNSLITENIIYGIPPATPSYWTTLKNGEFKAGANGIRWVNNYYGGFSQFGQFSGEDNLWGRDGNELSGNRYLDTDALANFNV